MNCPPVFVAAAVIERSNRFLLCRRPVHKRHGGLHEFPGGKFLPGEGIDSAVTRERSEELSVHVTSVGAELFSLADPGSEFVIRFVEGSRNGRNRFPAARHKQRHRDALGNGLGSTNVFDVFDVIFAILRHRYAALLVREFRAEATG